MCDCSPCRCGDLRRPERRLALPRRKPGGDVSEHLPPGLQLPRRLLPGCEPSCQGLCVPAAPKRAGTTPLCGVLPPGSVAAAPRRRTRRIKPRGIATVAQFLRRPPGHLPAHLLHRETEASERRSARRHH